MRRLFAGLLVLLGLTVSAFADESVRDFVSDVTVNPDASVTVHETITVNAEGDQIRHGIYRDIPTIYTDRHGVRLTAGFSVLSVQLDGSAEDYAIESQSNGRRVKIGKADVFVESGLHRYDITYRMTREIGFFNDYDELYWNVTGNGWEFPIDRAEVAINLPPGANIAQSAAYTGFMGARGTDFRITQDKGTVFKAETTRVLRASEGFTVAVAWPKGFVAAPTESQKWQWWLSDNAGIFGLIATLLAAAAYYFYAWNKVGRDPPKGTIIPLFTPPDGLGAAGSRFIWRQGFDDRCFAAGLVGLAVKGKLQIVDDEDVYSIQKKTDGGAPLTTSERVLYTKLPTGTTKLRQSNHAAISAVKSALGAALKNEYEGTVFLRNLGWFWKGALLSAVGLIVSALLMPAEDGLTGLFAVGWAVLWWGVILAVAWGSIKGVQSGRGILGKLGSIMTLLFMIPFIGAGIVAPVALMFSGGSGRLYLLMGTALLLGLMNLVFYYLLRAPTVPGRKLLDQLEGFRMYMSAAEEERLKILNPPEKTPELFERYLPYALALDCENQWNTKFAAVLATAAAAGATAPLWYSGSNWDAGRTGSFTDSLGSGLSSSISSASTAPGSSSGSGGGGSSGGGGGGGGGGGW